MISLRRVFRRSILQQEIINKQFLRYLAYQNDLLKFEHHVDHFFLKIYVDVMFTAPIKFGIDVKNERNHHHFHDDDHEIVFFIHISSYRNLSLLSAQQK
jgi:hypothetical protein